MILSSYSENLVVESFAALPLVRLTDGGTSPGVLILLEGSFSLDRSVVEQNTSLKCSIDCLLEMVPLPFLDFMIWATPDVEFDASLGVASDSGNVDGLTASLCSPNRVVVTPLRP